MSALARAPTAARSGVRPTSLPNWAAFLPNANERVPQLRWPRSVDTYAAMATDPQVAALKRAVALPVRRYKIELDPNGMDEAWAEALADDLDLPLRGGEQAPGRSPLRFSARRHLARALTFLDYGHFAAEIAGHIDEHDRWRLDDLQPIPQRTIARFDVDRTGRLERLWQWDTGGGGQVEIRADHLVFYTWGGEPGDPVGESMLRPLWRPYGIKDRALRLDLIKHERNSMGIPVGWVDENATGRDAEAMDEILAAMAAGEDAYVRLQRGQDFRLRGVEGQTSSPLDLVKFCNEEMGRALLAMVLQAGQTGNGTLTSAETHDSYLRMFHDVVIGTYCDQLTQQAAARWAQWNGIDPVARVVATPEDTEDGPETRAYYLEYQLLTIDEARARLGLDPLPDGRGERFPESFEVLARIEDEGVTAAAAEFNQARRQHGLKPMTEHQLIAASGAPRGAAPVEATGRRARPNAPAAARARRPVAASTDVPVPDRALRRQPTALEAASGVDFAQIDADWEIRQETVAETLRSARAQLADRMLDTIRDLDTVDPLTLADALGPALEEAATTVDTAALEEALQQAATDGVGQVVAEADRQGNTIDPPDLDYQDRAAAEARNAMRRLAGSLVETAVNSATAGAQIGAPGTAVSEVVEQAVDRLTDAQPEQAASGMTSRAQNAGRGHALDTSGYVEIYGSALLDTNTCPPCVDWDGRTFDTMDEALEQFPGGGGNKDCEGGDRCRCILVGVLATEQERAT